MEGKILLLTGLFPPLPGGISNMLYTLVSSLESENVRVIGLPSPGWQDFDSKQQFLIKRLNTPSSWSTTSSQYKFLFPFYSWKSIFEKDISVVLCGYAHHCLMLPAFLMHVIRGTSYGVIVNGTDLIIPQRRRYRWLFNFLLKKAQFIIAISRTTAEVAKSIGIKPERISIIHPSINVDESVNSESAERIREAYGVRGKKVLLTVGTLTERKGQDTVIEAMPEILQRFPNVHYLIVGGGPTETRLRSIVNELGLSNNVTFVGLVKNRNEVLDFFYICDVFVMVSRGTIEQGDIEGFGIVYLEANLFGKPVVASRSGGIPDAVLENETGLMVEPDNPLEVADAVKKLFLDPMLADRLGEAGRMRVLKEFSGRSAAQKLREVLEYGVGISKLTSGVGK